MRTSSLLRLISPSLLVLNLVAESVPATSAIPVLSVPVQAAQAAEKQREIFGCRWENNEFEVGLKNRDEIYYSHSTSLLSPTSLDQVLWAQGIWDLKTKAKIADNALSSQITIRNKYRWGSPESIAATSETPIKIGDTTTGNHMHYLSKQIFWLREGWLDINLNRAMGVETAGTQHFKLGLFPFELGRGIALGSAYAASSGLLGFYADSTVDQNAPGFLLSGDLLPDILTYDMYLGILRNWTDSFGRVNEKIYTDQLHRDGRGARGFGHVNFVYANRLRWSPVLTSDRMQGGMAKLVIEPYFMYNRDPEQRVEFPADAASNLMTAGLCTDYTGSRFEFGCEFAFNFGQQTVHGWDSNQIEVVVNSDGLLAERYTKVLTSDPNTNTNPAKAYVTSTNKQAVEKGVPGPNQNGQELGTSGLYNALNRYNAPYKNKYQGMMLVTDASMWLIDPSFKISGTLGWATGDENPNRDLDQLGDSSIDGNYQGFIGLQEIYSGKRVISLFIIGGNSLTRPLSTPSDAAEGGIPSKATGFTNLVYGGGAVTFKYNFCGREIGWNVGLLNYWQDYATKKFDARTKKSLDQPASRHLGGELNVTINCQFMKSLKGFLVGGVFIPGQHYDDIKNKPLSKDDLKTLDELNAGSSSIVSTPLLGTHPAYVLNWGIEYAF